MTKNSLPISTSRLMNNFGIPPNSELRAHKKIYIGVFQGYLEDSLLSSKLFPPLIKDRNL